MLVQSQNTVSIIIATFQGNLKSAVMLLCVAMCTAVVCVCVSTVIA